MAITPWSDAAKALVGAAFGNPEMRAKQEEMQLKKDQFDLEQQKYGFDQQKFGQEFGLKQQQFGLDQQKYGLDEAFNPFKMDQAAAGANLDRARAATEAITQAKSQIELDNILKFLGADTSTVPAVSDAGFNSYDARTLPPAPKIPFNPMTMGGALPVTEGPDQFTQLINGLTEAPTQVASPNGAAYFEDLGQAQEPMNLSAPAMALPSSSPTGMITPEMRQMIAAGYLKPENIGDLVLAAEGQNANQGITDPQKRIANAAAGTGTFLSPDQVLAQALGATRDTATLGNLAENNLGTADSQNYDKSVTDPGFADYLARKEAGPNFSVTNPDGTVISYGKQGGAGGKLTETQGKYALFGTRASQAQQNLEAVLTSDYGKDMDKLGFTNSVDFITGMSKPESATASLMNNALMSPDGRKLYQAANSFLTAIVRPDSGAALTPDEWQIYGKIFIPMPGDDSNTVAQKRLDRQIATSALQGLSNGGAQQVAQLLQDKGVPVPTELQVYLRQPGGAPAGNQTTGPVQITSDADYEALPSNTTFIAPDGSQRVKP